MKLTQQQDRETEPRFTGGAPARGGMDGGYGGVRGGFGGGFGGGHMGGGMGMQGGGGRQIFVSNVCYSPPRLLSVTDRVAASIPGRLAGSQGPLPPGW